MLLLRRVHNPRSVWHPERLVGYFVRERPQVRAGARVDGQLRGVDLEVDEAVAHAHLRRVIDRHA